MSIANKEALIIDDDEDTRALIAKILSNSGMSVTEAENVNQALELAQKVLPHIVITDLMMPEQSGFTFLEKRQEDQVLRRVPVLVVRALNTQQAVYEAISLGAEDYIPKPFTTTILLQKMRRILKDRKFCVVSYPPKSLPKLEVKVRGNITRLSEVGFLVESSVRFAPDQKLKIRSEVLEELALSDCVYQTSKRSGPLLQDNQYLNRIITIGLSENKAQQVRKNVMRWK